MTARPELVLTVEKVAGDPWSGTASMEFEGRRSSSFELAEIRRPEESHEVRWYVERFLELPEAGNLARAQSAENILRVWSERLRKLVSSHETGREWLKSIAGGGRLVVRTRRASDGPAFLLPWELLDPQGLEGRTGQELSLEVIRQQMAVPTKEEASLSGPLRILLVICRPSGVPFIDPFVSAEAILAASRGWSRVDIDICRPPILSKVEQTLEEARDAGAPYQVLHFDGHGTITEAPEPVGALCFQGPDASLDLVAGSRLVTCLRDVSLVFLEACNTSDDAAGQDAVALSLLAAGVEHVIGMGFMAHTDMTRALVATFYGSFFGGASVSESLLRARRAVADTAHRRIGRDDSTYALLDWFVPQLYQGARDMRFKGGGEPRSLERSLPVIEPRAYERHVLDGACFEHSRVTLHSVIGGGKSSMARSLVDWWAQTGVTEASPQWLIAHESFTHEALQDLLPPVREGSLSLTVIDDFDRVPPQEVDKIDSLLEKLSSDTQRILVLSRNPRVLSAVVVSIDGFELPDAIRFLAGHLQSKGQVIPSWEEMRQACVELDRHPQSLEVLAECHDGMSIAERAKRLAESPADFAATRPVREALEPVIASLTPRTRDLIPALALQRGGSLDDMAKQTAGVEEEAWRAARSEFEEAGLLRFDNSVLRPHPLLNLFAPPANHETAHRFIEAALGLCVSYIDHANAEVADGLNFTMRVCESVIRRAMGLALNQGNLAGAALLVNPLKIFLEREGKRMQGQELVRALHAQVGEQLELGSLGGALLTLEWIDVLRDTDPAQAAEQAKALIRTLEAGVDWDASHQVHRARSLLFAAETRLNSSPAPCNSDSREDKANQHSGLAERYLSVGDLVQAEREARLAVELSRASGNISSLARKLGLLAAVRSDQKRTREATELFTEALAHACSVDDREAESTIQLGWTKLNIGLGEFDDAVDRASAALAGFREAGDQRGQALALVALGDAERHRGQLERALAWFDEAVEQSATIAEPTAIAVAKGNRARVLAGMAERTDDPRRRKELFEQAVEVETELIEVWRRTGSHSQLGLAHTNIGNTLRLLGRLDEAEHMAREGLDVLEELRHPHTIAALRILERVMEDKGDDVGRRRFQSRRVVTEASLRGKELEPRVPPEIARHLISMAVVCRASAGDLAGEIELVSKISGGLSDFLEHLFAVEPGFAKNLVALSRPGTSRPGILVHSAYETLVARAWASLPSTQAPPER